MKYGAKHLPESSWFCIILEKWLNNKWASYSWHSKAFSSLSLFQSWSSWKPGLPLFCIPCHISCSLWALGNNSSGLFSLLADKLLSCTLKQSWLLNGCSPKQTNSSLTWKNVKLPPAAGFPAAGEGHSDLLTSPAINPVEGDMCMVCKRLRTKHWVIDGIFLLEFSPPLSPMALMWYPRNTHKAACHVFQRQRGCQFKTYSSKRPDFLGGPKSATFPPGWPTCLSFLISAWWLDQAVSAPVRSGELDQMTFQLKQCYDSASRWRSSHCPNSMWAEGGVWYLSSRA